MRVKNLPNPRPEGQIVGTRRICRLRSCKVFTAGRFLGASTAGLEVVFFTAPGPDRYLCPLNGQEAACVGLAAPAGDWLLGRTEKRPT
jgi:hypothetical protein